MLNYKEADGKRYRTFMLDIYRGGRFVKKDRVDVRLTKDFETLEWLVTNEEISRALSEKFPYLSKQKDVEFCLK